MNLSNGMSCINNGATVYATLLRAIQCRFPGSLDSPLHRGFRDKFRMLLETERATEVLISIPASLNPPSKFIMIAWKPGLGLNPLGQISSSRVHTFAKCPCVNIKTNVTSHIPEISLHLTRSKSLVIISGTFFRTKSCQSTNYKNL